MADRTWGLLRVLAGSVQFTMDTVPLMVLDLRAGDRQPIPPGIPHAVAIVTGTIEVDFLVES